MLQGGLVIGIGEWCGEQVTQNPPISLVARIISVSDVQQAKLAYNTFTRGVATKGKYAANSWGWTT